MAKFKNLNFLKIYIVEKTDKIRLKDILVFVKFMPKERIEKFNRLNLKQKKINCVLGFVLTWFVLKENNFLKDAPCFCYNKFNKPKIKNLNVFFNLSHTKKTIALAICSSPVGVDIELIKNFNKKLAKKALTKLEYLFFFLTFFKRKDLFFRFWTKKEAFVKKNGTSIFLNFFKKNSFFLKNTKTFKFKNNILAVSCDFKIPNMNFKTVLFKTIKQNLKIF